MNKEEGYRRITERFKRDMPKDITCLIRNEKDEQSCFFVEQICEKLFIDNNIDELDRCRELIESIDNPDDLTEGIREEIDDFLETLKTIKRLKKHERIEITKAEALKRNYAFQNAILIYEKLLANKPERKYEIHIRESLVDIYTEMDEIDKCHLNMKRLLELGVRNDDLISCYVLDIVFNDYPVEDLKIIKRLLKTRNAADHWKTIFKSLFRSNTKLIEVYEYVKPPVDVLDPSIIEMIVSEYYDDRSLKKAETILSKCQINNIWSADLSYYKAMILLEQQSEKEAEAVIDKELQDNPDNARINLCKGHILFEQQHFSKALIYYEIAFNLGEEIRSIHRIVHCELELGEEDKARHRLLEWVEKKNNKSGNIMIYLGVVYQDFSKEFMISFLEMLKPDERGPERYVDFFDIAIMHILKITENAKQKGLARLNLIKLLSGFESIKGNLKYKEHKGNIYHYSNLKSIQGLLSTDSTSKHFRLYNVAYMNDPAEGNRIYDVIEKYNQTELAELMECLREDEATLYRDNYIGSFSKKPDFLPMWIHYSAGGNGVCYSLTPDVFDTYDAFEHETIFGRNGRSKSLLTESKGFVLRNVCYCQGNSITDNKIIEELCNIISDLLVDLKEEIQQNEDIKTFIKSCIEDIRYLFKDDAYKSEEELRLIVKDNNEERKIEYREQNNAIPRLYIEMDKPIKFDEVMIGPKVSNVAELATYLNICTNVSRVSKSSIAYR